MRGIPAPLCDISGGSEKQFQVLLPQSNQAGRRLLERAGFEPERSWQSMRLGGSPDLGSRQWLYGYANFYVG